jgi:glycosyltransferase involved in cell wall biosynthesis
MTNTISTIVKIPVDLGVGNYASALTITSTGGVEPAAYGATGVSSAVNGASLNNAGVVIGGSGASPMNGPGGTGGVGVAFYASGTLTNTGSITGGTGGYASNGGVGVNLTSGVILSNSGSIHGGSGEYNADGVLGAGGNGLDMSGGAQVTNDGSIVGGAGGYSDQGPGSHAIGGTGVYMSGGSLSNVGTIIGGGEGSYGGAGLIAAAGTVSNAAQGDIEGAGGAAGVIFSGTTFSNAGQISGGTGYYVPTNGGQAGGWGLDLQSGALTNTGSISGGYSMEPGYGGGAGVRVTAGASVVNSGTITGGGDFSGAPGGAGVLGYGASVSNSGAITGGAVAAGGGLGGIGVYLRGDGGSLSNSGTITGGAVKSGGSEGSSGGVGVAVYAPATLSNAATGTITGGAGYAGYAGQNGYSGGAGGTGMELSGSAILTNSGTINGGEGGAGGAGAGGGAGTNGGAGGAGVYLSGATLINAGTISGGAGGLGGAGSGSGAAGTNGATGAAVQFGPNSGAATLVDEPGAVFNGQVSANTTVNDTLQLQGTQTIAGTPITLGTQFTGFSTLSFATGAEWSVDATTASLISHAPAIDGFALGDVLDVTDLAPGATASFNTATEALTVKDGSTSFNLQFNSAFAGDKFVLTAAGAGTDISLQVAACYLEGTQILTEDGERAIETLKIGDRVWTRSGEYRPIRWIGRRRYSAAAAWGKRDLMPVVISAGALGEGQPRRDLCVSPEHAMYLEGMLIPARALINGSTIRQPEHAAEIRYVHLEFETHDVIIAEGALSESFIDDASRGIFDNAAEYAALYPEAPRGPATYCAPRIEDGADLQRVRTTIAARTPLATSGSEGLTPCTGCLDLVRRDLIEGWASDATSSEPVRLCVFDNGRPLLEVVANHFRKDLEDAGIGAGRHGFSVRVPGGLTPDEAHVIEVKRASDGRSLPGSPVVLPPQAPLVLKRTVEAPLWQGSLDRVTRELIEGWAWDRRTPDEPLALAVLDNGELIARVIANGHRADLANAGLGDGRHAFTLVVPGGMSPLRRHVIQVLSERDGCEIPGSPVIIEAAGRFDPALEGAVTAAVASLTGPDEEERALAFLTEQTARVRDRRADHDSGRALRELNRMTARRKGPGNATAGPRPTQRALIIDEGIPQPDRDAGAAAIVSHMRALQDLDYEVSFTAAHGFEAPTEAGAPLHALGIRCCLAPIYSSVEEVLRRHRDAFDLIYLHRVSTASKYLPMAREYVPRARIVYAVADLHHLRLARQAHIEGRPELLRHSRSLKLAECLALSAADAVITHSSAEATRIREAVKGANVHVVPWAVPLRTALQPWADRSGVAFIGNFAFDPNLDAARYLVEEIMPRVWRQEPSIHCRLVGSRMPSQILRLTDARVHVVGHVANLDEVFNAVRLTVAPLRYGAGIKGKVLESFAAGLPCVLTPIAAEGMDLPEPLASAVALDADGIAATIVRLHRDGQAAEVLADAGRQFVGARYQHAHVVAALKAAIETRWIGLAMAEAEPADRRVHVSRPST